MKQRLCKKFCGFLVLIPLLRGGARSATGWSRNCNIESTPSGFAIHPSRGELKSAIFFTQWKQTILFCLFLLFSPLYGYESIEVIGAADKSALTIGDVLNYSVTFISSEPVKIMPPDKTEELGQWAVRDIKLDGQAVNFSLATFSTGTIIIPQISFKYTGTDGRQAEIKSSSTSVSVESVIDKIGDKGDIVDIKPPWAIRMPVGYYLTIILIVLAIAAGLYIWYRKYRQRTSPGMEQPLEPAEPPYDKAMRKLEELKNSGLISEGKIKEYYIALFDIVREFLSGLYTIETLERTSSEIYQELKRVEKDKVMLSRIKDFFDECDMVKFAKYRPEEKICFDDWDAACNIIKGK